MEETNTSIKENINYLEFSNKTFYIIIVLLISIILLILYNNYYCSKIKKVKIKTNLLDTLDKNINITNHPKQLEEGNNSFSTIFEKKYDLNNEINKFHIKQDQYIETL